MSTGGLIPETAKALSAPVTKLVEVIAAGCGALYEPTAIRRKAKAEGHALVLTAEARARADEVSLRAVHRLLDVEIQRQRNIEAIANAARQALPDQVSDEPVRPDWAVRFFREAQDVNDEQMRHLWARLLAGEVTHPGSFSARTLTVVRDLSASEADLFNALCLRCLKVNRRWIPMFPHRRRYEILGFNVEQLLQLQAAGLVTIDVGLALEASQEPIIIETRGGRRYRAIPNRETHTQPFSLGDVMLTDSGHELASLAVGDEQIEHLGGHLEWLTVAGWIVETEDI